MSKVDASPPIIPAEVWDALAGVSNVPATKRISWEQIVGSAIAQAWDNSARERAGTLRKDLRRRDVVDPIRRLQSKVIALAAEAKSVGNENSAARTYPLACGGEQANGLFVDLEEILCRLDVACRRAMNIVVNGRSAKLKPLRDRGAPTRNNARKLFLYDLICTTKLHNGQLPLSANGDAPAGALTEALEILRPLLPMKFLPLATDTKGWRKELELVRAHVNMDMEPTEIR